ncbi:hypothetical protein [Mesonia sp. HuA40]|uniref:hypothetical protein n=1 Tax=Mesonia sp. HuA40 TaxID=2602761 RepID=UPI0011C7D039|nr:hypothetical protein [Mesonia sp. HuA40]TXK70597.1 hypothetical protein FT993_11810 [Mesonia sp. HuA40]
MKNTILFIILLVAGGYLAYIVFNKEMPKPRSYLTENSPETSQNKKSTNHSHVNLIGQNQCLVCKQEININEESSVQIKPKQFLVSNSLYASSEIKIRSVQPDLSHYYQLKVKPKSYNPIYYRQARPSPGTFKLNPALNKFLITQPGEVIGKFFPKNFAGYQLAYLKALRSSNKTNNIISLENNLYQIGLNAEEIKKIKKTGKPLPYIEFKAPNYGKIILIDSSEANEEQFDLPLFEFSNKNLKELTFKIPDSWKMAKNFTEKIFVTINNNDIPLTYLEKHGLILKNEQETLIKILVDFKNIPFEDAELLNVFLPKQRSEKEKKPLLIPQESLTTNAKGEQILYVKTYPKHLIFESRKVVVKKHSKLNYEVIKGLRPGEYIVTQNVETLNAIESIYESNYQN